MVKGRMAERIEQRVQQQLSPEQQLDCRKKPAHTR